MLSALGVSLLSLIALRLSLYIKGTVIFLSLEEKIYCEVSYYVRSGVFYLIRMKGNGAKRKHAFIQLNNTHHGKREVKLNKGARPLIPLPFVYFTVSFPLLSYDLESVF